MHVIFYCTMKNFPRQVGDIFSDIHIMFTDKLSHNHRTRCVVKLDYCKRVLLCSLIDLSTKQYWSIKYYKCKCLLERLYKQRHAMNLSLNQGSKKNLRLISCVYESTKENNACKLKMTLKQVC